MYYILYLEIDFFPTCFIVFCVLKKNEQSVKGCVELYRFIMLLVKCVDKSLFYLPNFLVQRSFFFNLIL